MSLTLEQQYATIHELAANLALTGLTKAQVCADLNISAAKLDRILNLQQVALEDPWILKNYLMDQVTTTGQSPIAFTALVGDYHQYWFLNSHLIDAGKLSAGDN